MRVLLDSVSDIILRAKSLSPESMGMDMALDMKARLVSTRVAATLPFLSLSTEFCCNVGWIFLVFALGSLIHDNV
jgi:hypothetical protein